MAMFRKKDLNLLFRLKHIFSGTAYDLDSLKMMKSQKEVTDFFLNLLSLSADV